MKKPLDRVTEAYYDQVGLGFGEKVRNRIHWVCEQAKGESILDIGCSQGITSILLGRESKKVLGIDLLQESIDYANEMLNSEAEVTKKYVEFRTANFIDFDFEEQKFDSIILGEILEHITDTERFIKKATNLLSDNGRIIVTVPFGINDYFDHKKTYYMQGLVDLQNKQLNINSIEVLGKWIGAVFVKNEAEAITIDRKQIGQLEDGFYNLERNLLDQLTAAKSQKDRLEKRNNETQTKLKEKTNEIDELNSTIEELNKTIEHVNEVNENLKLSISKTEDDYNDLKSLFSKQESDNNSKDIELKQKELLIKDLTYKLEESERKNELLESEKTGISQKINELTQEINVSNQNAYDTQLRKDKRITFLEQKLADFRQKDKKQQNQLKKLQKQSEKMQTQNKKQNNKQVQNQIITLQQEVLNEKKKKVKSDELLLEAYNKEEKLLKTHSQLMKRYEALKTSKLGSLTISYWKWRRRRFGGKTSGTKSN
ncbi:methyltransferase domain-containing protein [Oceanobacillus aidingensis]|uniref:Methyltransferase domain-containing protein n=1 Tax=Oceanobacillus aidingensis TaxID=645964 RepID=A0ABV9JUT0_9BACI